MIGCRECVGHVIYFFDTYFVTLCTYRAVMTFSCLFNIVGGTGRFDISYKGRIVYIVGGSIEKCHPARSYANMLPCLRSRLVNTALLGSCRQVRQVSTALCPKPVSPLSFDLHAPANPKADEKTAPIIFLHGLFGSKKNNRGISK